MKKELRNVKIVKKEKISKELKEKIERSKFYDKWTKDECYCCADCDGPRCPYCGEGLSKSEYVDQFCYYCHNTGELYIEEDDDEEIDYEE